MVTAVFETVRVEAGRVRLLDRHLARLALSAGADAVDAAARLVAEACAQGGPTSVVRIDAGPGGVAATARAPSSRAAVDLRGVVAFDPADGTREQKRRDRAWALAAEAEAGGEALCVSADGLVGETTRANVFAILATGEVVTPPAQGVLPGVTRSWAITALGATEAPLPLATLRAARAAFLTTAGRGVVRVSSVDGVPLGDDPALERLAAAWRAL